ncbi:GNAT family N-acetyltransferase [Corallococcus sp. ZKHCc1 1396]|uniref:GNAT family N-acetyltransferase n=1 Tax=Corallococcus soli TaxID=2710757 RepID=A0ABR9Q0K8_9BACT|nr:MULTISPECIES: GNAT family N-acetyltransferase [Corallococcus]MBE4753674.1 GNAT family N-acetyltransferase [Corallococcus soli]MCY1035164.1 GNAT family N-acetyltransferase [Corallococcus sp. BB11-1]
MLTLGPTLETPRLILRPPTLQDLDGFAAMMADPESARFIGGLQPRSNVWRAVCAMAGSWVLQGYAMFSVFEKSTGKWVGRVGPWMPDGWPGTEVGWGLLREHWGKGYASESSAATIDWAFDNLGWTEVIHSIAPENTPSKQVAQRLGSRFLRMGHLPAPYDADPTEIWGQSREEWRTRKK